MKNPMNFCQIDWLSWLKPARSLPESNNSNRESYDMFAVNGILFNHESPRRGETFVTRKITRALTRIKLGLQKKLYLGNLDAKRDWGHAQDFIEAQWLMLQQEKADDYVIATGEQHSVREFVEKAAAYIDINIEWRGQGRHEIGIDTQSGACIVEIDPGYFRPTEVETLLGDASKAKRELGWEPKIGFDELVREMVAHDYKLAQRDTLMSGADNTSLEIEI